MILEATNMTQGIVSIFSTDDGYAACLGILLTTDDGRGTIVFDVDLDNSLLMEIRAILAPSPSEKSYSYAEAISRVQSLVPRIIEQVNSVDNLAVALDRDSNWAPIKMALKNGATPDAYVYGGYRYLGMGWGGFDVAKIDLETLKAAA